MKYNLWCDEFSTGIKRILEGEIKPAASRSEEGKLHVKYTTFPLTPETNYAVLETDYKNYAVLWSCQGIGPINAQNAWLMTRSRRPAAEVLQMVIINIFIFTIKFSFHRVGKSRKINIFFLSPGLWSS